MFFLKKRKNHSCRQWKERTPEIFSSVQLRRSVVSNSATPGVAASQASLFITDSRTLPKPMSAESVTPSSHLVLCRPFSSCPQSRPASGLFSSESPLHIRWPQDSRFSLSVRPSSDHPGLTSFRTDWLGLLAVQGTLKSLLQHHSAKASILRRSAFFTVQLSHPYMTTGKTTAFTRQTLLAK